MVWKDNSLCVQSHRELFEEIISMCLMDFSVISAESRNRGRIIHKRTMDDLIWWRSHTPYPSWEIHKVLKGLIQAEMLPARTEGTEKGQNKQRPLSSPNSAVFWKYFPLWKGDSMIQFLYCKHLLPSRRNQNVSEGGASGSEDKTKDPELWSSREEPRNM